MNPISGTYRYPAGGPTAERLLDFLADRKEIEELSMVVDEELKMMCTVGDMGGVVVGPYLKEMAHLAHTEYELRGRSSLDVREVLRETMFAPTVTGIPVQNACRVIARHEAGGRGYYAGVLALLGRDAGGAPDPRLADPHPHRRHRRGRAAAGAGRRHAGAALGPGGRGRRDARQGGRGAGRAGGACRRGRARRPYGRGWPTTRGCGPRWTAGGPPGAVLAADAGARHRSALDAAHALVVDAEDTFTAMLAHQLRVLGARGDRAALRRAGAAGGGARRTRGPVVLGPGPGDPSDLGRPEDAVPARADRRADRGSTGTACSASASATS